MGYRDDDRYGDDNRWREDSRSGGFESGRFQGRGGYDRDRERERGRWGGGDRPGYGGGDDRGFFDRAGDEVRSWFGDDEAQRRREMDERRWERERGMTGRRDNDDGRGRGEGGSYGWMSGGWGNQAGESWNRDRPGVREGWFTDSVGGERGHRYGGSGSGGFAGRDRSSGGRGGDIHDPHYSEWRQRQIEELDRDYDEYRREHQSKFEQEFGTWRSKRQGQRQSLRNVAEHMAVVGSDGQHVGTVDAVRGDRIVLAKNDENAGGLHHSVPCGWVESVDDKVTLNRTAEQAMNEWREEERSRALFERQEAGSEGPHVLNRSFSGTYSDSGPDR